MMEQAQFSASDAMELVQKAIASGKTVVVVDLNPPHPVHPIHGADALASWGCPVQGQPGWRHADVLGLERTLAGNGAVLVRIEIV